jgi:hypothetical protein
MNPPPATATSLLPSADDATEVQLSETLLCVQVVPEFAEV